jgi:hypothetical protein
MLDVERQMAVTSPRPTSAFDRDSWASRSCACPSGQAVVELIFDAIKPFAAGENFLYVFKGAQSAPGPAGHRS